MINESIDIELVNVAGNISLPKILNATDFELIMQTIVSCESCDGSCNTCYQ